MTITILLLIFILNSSVVQSQMDPDLDDEDAPFRERSLFEIVWVCTSMIFLCAWVTVHRNIPQRRESFRTALWGRFKMLFWVVVVPELVLAWAARQWVAAKEIAKVYNNHHREARIKWTTIHGHFLIMGGFILVEPSDLPRDEEPRILSFEIFQSLVRDNLLESTITEITGDEIMDRSKIDGLSRFLTILHTLWFIVQCIARHMYHLPLTEFELVTLALSSVSGMMYIPWWNKPREVRVPIKVYLIKNLMTVQTNPDVPGGTTNEDLGHEVVESPRSSPVPQSSPEIAQQTNSGETTNEDLENEIVAPPRQAPQSSSVPQSSHEIVQAGGQCLRQTNSGETTNEDLGNEIVESPRRAPQSSSVPQNSPEIVQQTNPDLPGETTNEDLENEIVESPRHALQNSPVPQNSPEIVQQTNSDLPGETTDEDLENEIVESPRQALQGSPVPQNSPEIVQGGTLEKNDDQASKSVFTFSAKDVTRTSATFLKSLTCIVIKELWDSEQDDDILSLLLRLSHGIYLLPAYLLFLVFFLPIFVLLFIFASINDIINTVDFPSKARMVPTFYAPRTENERGIEFIVFAIIGIVYGGFHCMAWHFVFPTRVDQIFWRTASVAITALPLLSIFIGLIRELSKQETLTQGRMVEKNIMGIVEVLSSIVLIFLFFVHVSARLLLLGHAIWLLREQPVRVYLAVDWTFFIPHIL